MKGKSLFGSRGNTADSPLRRRFWPTRLNILPLALAVLAAIAAPRLCAQTWTSHDIGTATVGSTVVSGESVTLRGSGRDIWNTSDGFRFHAVQTSDDFELVARVRSLEYTHGWAKAGLMARWGLAADAVHRWICVSAAHGTAFQGRASVGAESYSTPPTEDGTAPRWLRLTRTTYYMYALLVGYTSHDGVTWTETDRSFVSHREPLQIGLAVTSHNEGVLCRAEFDNVRLTLPPAAPTGLRVVHRGPDGRIDLEWTDNSTDETHFVIEGMPEHRDSSFATLGQVAPNVTRFTARVSSLYGYTIQVRAFRGNVSSISPWISTWATLPPVVNISSVTANAITLQLTDPGLTRTPMVYGPHTVERSTDNVRWTVLATGITGFGAYYTDNTVVSGTTYYYRVRYEDAEGNVSSYATTPGITPQPALPAPTELVARAFSGYRVDLQWRDNSGGAGGFEIYRRTPASGPAERIGTTAAGVTTFTDLGARPGTEYLYYVVMTGDRTSSPSSNTVLLTTPLDATPLPAPSSLIATVVSSTRIDLVWNDNSSDEGGFRIDRSTDGSTFAVAGHTGANVRSWSDTTVTASTTYYYRVVASRATEVSAPSNTATATTAGAPVPNTWHTQDVGDVAVAGSSSEAGGIVTLRGSGADIWNTADEFRFRYMAWNGDGEIIARVDDLTNTHGWAKAGVMFRETLSGPSRHAWMCVSVAHGSAFQHRPAPGGDSLTSAPSESGGIRQWVRVVRSGNTFRGYVSPDGANWTEAGSVTLALPPTLYVGLAMTSHNDGVLGTAVFSQVTVRGMAPPPTTPPLAPASLAGTARSANQVDLAWTDTANNESGFEVEASSGSTAFARIATLAANTTSFSHTGLAPNTSYTYRVRASNAAGASGYSNTVTVITPATSPDPAAWFAQDVGPVAAAGSASESGGVITLRGSGRDIWNTEDGFHYRYRAWTGDGTITARVTSLTNTNGWAKAGLMFRETLTGPSRHVWMCVSSAHGTALQQRAITGGESTTTAPTEAGGVPRWLRLTRSGNTFTGYESADGVTWVSAGSITLALPGTIYLGVAVTSHNDGVLCTATFQDVSIATGTTPPPLTPTEPPPTTPPATWAFADIGAVGLAGSNTSSGNTITVRGAGADIWERADGFRFVYRQLTGDGLVEARVDSMTYTNGWAKAGVMIRESLNADARNVFACVTPIHHGIVAQARAATGGDTASVAGPGRNAPSWVRVRRTGSTFIASWSADGVAWTEFGTFTVPMGATAYFGFAVTSHDTTQLNTAVFSDPFVQ